jgi:hypothetical protein
MSVSPDRLKKFLTPFRPVRPARARCATARRKKFSRDRNFFICGVCASSFYSKLNEGAAKSL